MTREEKAQKFARNCAEYNNLPIEVEHLLHTAFIAGYNEREDEEKKTCHQVSEEPSPVDNALAMIKSTVESHMQECEEHFLSRSKYLKED